MNMKQLTNEFYHIRTDYIFKYGLHESYFREMYELLIKKNHDYSNTNDVFSNFKSVANRYECGGWSCNQFTATDILLFHVYMKLDRIFNLTNTNIKLKFAINFDLKMLFEFDVSIENPNVHFESIHDTVIDLANYLFLLHCWNKTN